MKARTTAQKNSCINNLRQIESAKDQYAVEQGKTNGWTFTSEESAFSNLVGLASGYIKTNPACPASSSDCAKGTIARAVLDYTVNAIGTPPVCAVAGSAASDPHVLQ